MLRWMCGVTRRVMIRNEHITGTTRLREREREREERENTFIRQN